MVTELKLQIELVPSTSWGSNLRSSMSQEDWDVTRRATYKEYRYRCGLCGSAGMMHCHERWEYDDKKHVQKLLGFIALCPLCHHIKHIGLAQILHRRGELDYEALVEHFMEVNGCNHSTFYEHRAHSFELWNERSRHLWVLDLGEYASLITVKRA